MNPFNLKSLEKIVLYQAVSTLPLKGALKRVPAYFPFTGVRVLLLILLSCSYNWLIVREAQAVRPPLVFENVQAQLHLDSSGDANTCKGPEPYKGNMVFRCRYEGSGRARDKLNIEAEKAYLDATKPMQLLQRFLAKETDKIVKGKANMGRLDCVLRTLLIWAKQSDLHRITDNHTGKAVRKWTLAAISANLLKVDQLAEQRNNKMYTQIKFWIARLATQVMADFSDRPLKKINNHDYWAAWSVITSAVLLDRPDMFAWSEGVFVTAMGQVNEQGFLPNELRRRSRAAMYHNYALTPLIGIAAFLYANGNDPFQYNNGALGRLVAVVLNSVDDVSSFKKKTGVTQVSFDLTVKGRLSWLAIFDSIAHLAPPVVSAQSVKVSQSVSRLTSSRMGGDLGFMYLGQK